MTPNRTLAPAQALVLRQGYAADRAATVGADRTAAGLPHTAARRARRRAIGRHADGLCVELAVEQGEFPRPDDLPDRAAGRSNPAADSDRRVPHARAEQPEVRFRHCPAADAVARRGRPAGGGLVEKLERTWISRKR
ncbi:hypothetical protein [Streptomyces sp. ISL-100]|uniref:hypothetical protein n=1 Tax=Streptomyces sp. ISL-100 TaxID=2819173 RepID=UPI001BEA53C2|nr:hypothetical protein [Streptomyces sp. ISL-100]MBT2398641.1 hypothetical protein [Streptomyces sp. ISL-100]